MDRQANLNAHSTGTLQEIAIKAATRAPMVQLESVQITRENGIPGDYRGSTHSRQVTILSRESWELICRELQADLPWTTRRANLLISGLDLQNSTGALLRIGDALLEVTGETKPCFRMDEAHPGLREALSSQWRGGVTGRVLEGGWIAAGAPVEVVGDRQ